MNLTSPVLFLIFNRPDLTKRVFERIREASPRQLFIAADGPRSDVPTDEERCTCTRQIVDLVDWECEVHTLFRKRNLGCKKAVSSAIDWFFDHVEEGVILEDDCLPDITFFRFCEELLERYRNDQRIMMISGDNYQIGTQHGKYSYYFSRYTHIWGWAAWRRAWKFFDADMMLWPGIRDNGLLSTIYETPSELEHRYTCFERAYSGDIDTWDYAWSFACLSQSGLVIRPKVNLVSNIGFAQDATHTKIEGPNANFPRKAMQFPLQHPSFVMIDKTRDRAEVDFLLGTSKKDISKRSLPVEWGKKWECCKRGWRALKKRIANIC